MDTSRSAWLGVGMDELDPVRELVVEAMAELEQALIDGLPAQAPQSSREEIKSGLAALGDKMESAALMLEKAEQRLSNVS